MNSLCETSDLIVFSHLRWDFLVQRPQHILTRYAKYRRVFYFEEPILGMTEIPRLHLRETSENVLVVIPYLPSHIDSSKTSTALCDLVDELIYEEEIIDYSLWYYSPMALAFTQHLEPRSVIYDCISDFSTFNHCPTTESFEEELLRKSDLVFTAGQSLYEEKKDTHFNIHPIPSSIDYAHFSQARLKLVEPDDQINIPHPRVGFYGLLNEQFDFDLLVKLAENKPDFHFIIVGPTTVMSSRSFPQKSNIHYLGRKDYHALPLYLAGWDCAMLPFIVGDVTKFLSPEQIPEILAAGKPVVSTRIKDIVHPYGEKNLVRIADSSTEFIKAIEQSITERKRPEWLDRVDHFLKENSWDMTFKKMVKKENEIKSPPIDHQLSHPRIIRPQTLSASGAI